jgi:hypothetical protein
VGESLKVAGDALVKGGQTKVGLFFTSNAIGFGLTICCVPIAVYAYVPCHQQEAQRGVRWLIYFLGLSEKQDVAVYNDTYPFRCFLYQTRYYYMLHLDTLYIRGFSIRCLLDLRLRIMGDFSAILLGGVHKVLLVGFLSPSIHSSDVLQLIITVHHGNPSKLQRLRSAGSHIRSNST